MIVMDAAYRKHEKAMKKYRDAYNRAYNLAERGYDERAARILERINNEKAAADREFARTKKEV